MPQAGMKWKIRNGARISFWFDCWAGPEPLVNFTHHSIVEEERDLKLSDLINLDGKLNLGLES